MSQLLTGGFNSYWKQLSLGLIVRDPSVEALDLSHVWNVCVGFVRSVTPTGYSLRLKNLILKLSKKLM